MFDIFSERKQYSYNKQQQKNVHVSYHQLINYLLPLIFREAGCCGYRRFLPESSASRVQFLQVTLTELDQMWIDALFARPLNKIAFILVTFIRLFGIKLCSSILSVVFDFYLLFVLIWCFTFLFFVWCLIWTLCCCSTANSSTVR